MNIKLVNIISISAVAILLVTQLYVITEIWETNTNNIKLLYHTMVTEALNSDDTESTNMEGGFDAINRFTKVFNTTLPEAIENGDSAKYVDVYRFNAVKLIDKTEDIHTIVEEYLKSRGMTYEVTDSVQILDLSLFTTSKDTIDIINDRKKIADPTTMNISSFAFENSEFSIRVGYLINIKNLSQMIFNKAWFLMLVTILSFLIVCYIFWLTYKNLLKEAKLSSLKTDFINNMTHELKTPLSTISVATKMLNIKAVNSDPEAVIAKSALIDKQNKHLNLLINKLLDINMWEREDFTMDLVKVDIASHLNDVISSFKEGSSNSIEVNYNSTIDSDTQIETDLLYFPIMINNLLTNSVKYSKESPIIDINLSRIKDNVEISIKDNGIGIASEDIEGIFDKFYRVGQGDLHNVKGLGLGLYYVKKIAVAHKGDISVESKLNRGTTFKILIPTV